MFLITGKWRKCLELCAPLLLLVSVQAQAKYLIDLPTWSDEQSAYQTRGHDSVNAFPHIDDGRYTSNLTKFTGLQLISDTHDSTEGDDLWVAYKMYKRLLGIHPQAAAEWFTRAQNLAGFFKNNYIGGSGWNEDVGFNHDHIYGWGLCEWIAGEGDTSAIATLDQIVNEMVAWNASDFVVNPGDSIFNVGTGGRRWARQLRLAVCAAEVSPTQTNIAWRDKVIDIVLNAQEWDPARKMYWLGGGPTNNSSRLGTGAYANGDRIAISFHMGIWMEALWNAWRALDAGGDPRANSVRARIIDMASFYRDIGPDTNGALDIHLGYNINTGAVIRDGGSGSPAYVYNLGPINGLVMAYKFTGDATFLNTAWDLYTNFQADQSGQTNTIDHFVDAEIASATGFQFLANNKGELQYTYALFENGGNPILMDGNVSIPKAPMLLASTNTPPSPPPPPTVTLSTTDSTVDEGDSTTITWSSSGAETCSSSGGWNGNRATQGSEIIGPLSSSTTYSLSCTGQSGTDFASVTVTVNLPQAPPGTLPDWYASAPDRSWIDMSQATGSKSFQDFGPGQGGPDDPTNWSYATANPHTSSLRKWNGALSRGDYYVMAFGGGHIGGAMNVVYEFGPLSSTAPDWHWYGTDPTLYEEPSNSLNWGSEKGKAFYSDGKPSSRHTYSHVVWIPDLGSGEGRVLFAPWATGIWNNDGTSLNKASSFKITSNTSVGGSYEAQNTYPDWPGQATQHGGGGLYDQESGKVWIYAPTEQALYSFDPLAKSYELVTNTGISGGTVHNVAIDPERRILIVTRNAGGKVELGVFDIDSEGTVPGSNVGDFVSPNYSNHGWTRQYTSVEFEPKGKKFVGYVGGSNIYTMTPPSNYRVSGRLNANADWSWVALSNAAGAQPPSDSDEGGIQNRLQYIESIGALAVVVNSGQSGIDSSMYVYKIPANGL